MLFKMWSFNWITTASRGEIQAMIKKNKAFVAVMFGETINLQLKFQLSYILWHVDEKEKTWERILGFIDVSKDRKTALQTEV